MGYAKKPAAKLSPSEVEFKKLKNRIGISKKTGTYRTKIREFLHGNEVNVDREVIDFLRVFLDWKKRRSLKRYGKLETLTSIETNSIKRAFDWVLRGMKPELTEVERTRIVNSCIRRCRKISYIDVQNFLATRNELETETKQRMFGRISMYLSSIDPENAKKSAGGDYYRKFAGLSFQDEILLPTLWNDEIKYESTAAHELGHMRLKLDEPLCYAIGTFYKLQHGKMTLQQIENEIKENNDTRQGYLEGLNIVRNALRNGGNHEQKFWETVRTLARNPEHQWNPNRLS